ncbi:hypothetical protein HDV03_004529 [Kappamyces sp. JEL0829]|nr:hypothetical protein HDV03_004529 [Kappamyces sp. JEL0829]
MQKRSISDIAIRANQVFQRTGPGGRSSNEGLVSTVFGASGMLGRTLVNNLGKKGTTIVAPYRGVDDDRRHLKVMADLGKLVQLRFDLRNEGQIVESLRHSDIVYNCIGRSFTTKNFSYDAVHHQGARRLARLAKEAGVQKFVHVSALNADVDSKSAFLKSKALGEIAVREEFPEATIVRPSWMYGYEDRFWNKMGWFVKWAPFSIIPLPDWGHATMRPVYVADVAIALSAMTKEDSAVGKTVELYGPSEYTYKGLVELFEDASMRPHHAVPVPKLLLKPLATVWDKLLAFPILSPDEVERLTISDRFSADALTFRDLNILPHTAEETIHRFASMYRDGKFSDAPFLPLTKDYTKV